MQQNPDRPVPRRHGRDRGRGRASHRAKPAKPATQAGAQEPGTTLAGTGPAGVFSVLLYVLVLSGVVAGLFVALTGSRYSGRGTGLVGSALLAAALVRLALPPCYAGLLATRHKVIDVLAFAVLGGGVLGLALWLP